ncbi:FAD binding domain-containing protein [Xylariales sp. AK1849]|nr:FAD binding domain-containing protein [Xylariales sp. AK1849]
MQSGQWVLIHGAAGSTASMLVRICAAARARVIGTVSTAAKGEVALRNGAEVVVNTSKEDWVGRVKETTKKRGVDAIFDGVVKSLLVEKYPQRLDAPKAHALSPRSFELCRQFGLDTKAMRKLGSPREDAFWVHFLTNLTGERIGVLPYERMDPEVLDDTPEMIHNIPQPDFEQFVAKQLENDPNVEIRKGVSFVSCQQSKDIVTSTLEVRESKHQFAVCSRHLVGCDGAKSQVRKFLGIECEGEDSYETMMTIHFNADLRPIVKDRVGMLHWITDPGCSGFIIAYDLSGNQVLISNFDSKRHPVESWNEELSRKVVTSAIGMDVPFQVLSYRPWVLSRKVANQYRVGNVFLAGDAAHSFPPTGGLGLNTGISDVHNLAYKIAAVHRGWAKPGILDSYQSERQPIALINAAQSVKNGKAIFSFLKALGMAGIEDVEEARANLNKSIHDPAKQEMIKRGVEGQREHFDNLELHIGYVYGREQPPPHASHYSPKFVAGARLPHAWIKFQESKVPAHFTPIDVSYVKEWTGEEISGRAASTLDLCPFDSLTLIVGSRGAWGQRVQTCRGSLKRHNIQISLWASDTDFEFVYPKQEQLFAQGAQLADGGGILVRPDQHILAILDPEASTKDVGQLVLDHLGFSSSRYSRQNIHVNV